VISEIDIYRAANLLIERHGADAVIEAARATAAKAAGRAQPRAVEKAPAVASKPKPYGDEYHYD